MNFEKACEHFIETGEGVDRCNKCGEWKPVSSFSRRRGKPISFCRECVADATKQWTEKNPLRQKQNALRWRQENRFLGSRREEGLKTKYILSLEQWDALFERQGRVCAICLSPSHGNKHWATDHDHKTGNVRGILCHKCNITLGFYEKAQGSITAIQSYLQSR